MNWSICIHLYEVTLWSVHFAVHVLCRRELYHLQRDLLRERTRCKALEEELENPMNIHRWRKLEVLEMHIA